MEEMVDIVKISRDISEYHLIQFSDAIAFLKKASDNWHKTVTLKPLANEIEWKLPNEENLHKEALWKDEYLQELKVRLNIRKGELNQIDIFKWNAHTYDTNPAFRIKTMFQTKAEPEFMSTAFLKLYEILNRYDVLPEEVVAPDESQTAEKEFRTMHLCEAPGAFIVALNHYLSSQRIDLKRKWNWTGHSLNPYFEGNCNERCIDDDRLIYHTRPNWFFGSDQTGDIIEAQFLRELQLAYGRTMHLVTADGSVDCQGDPGEQEMLTHRLHLAETIAAMAILQQNGCLVLKMFTFFECASVNMLYLIGCAFDAVDVVKPITSKWANSEVYIVARGFQPSVIDGLLPALIDRFDDETFCSIPKSYLSDSFTACVKSCANFFCNHQETAISYNLQLFQENKLDLELNSYLKTCVLRLFRDNVDYSKIKYAHYLLDKEIELCPVVNPMKGVESWSLSMWQCSLSKKMFRLTGHLHRMNKNITQIVKEYAYEVYKRSKPGGPYPQNDIREFRILLSELMPNFRISRGKTFTESNISRFSPKMALSRHKFSLELFALINANWKSALETQHNQRMADTTIYVNAKFSELSYVLADELRPSGRCVALDEIMKLLRQNEIKTHQNVCIVNAQMFTRLQIGMMLFIASFFERVEAQFARPDIYSYIIFHKFNNQNSAYVNQLEDDGWLPGGSESGTWEIFPLEYLVGHHTYKTIVNYNYSYCIKNSLSILKLLEGYEESDCQ